MIDRRPTANFLGYTIWIAGKLKQSNNNQRRSLPSITFSSRSQKTATTTMKSRIRGELFYKKEIRNCPLWTDDDDVSLVVVVMMMKEKCFLLSFFTAKKVSPHYSALRDPSPLSFRCEERALIRFILHSSFFMTPGWSRWSLSRSRTESTTTVVGSQDVNFKTPYCSILKQQPPPYCARRSTSSVGRSVWLSRQ